MDEEDKMLLFFIIVGFIGWVVGLTILLGWGGFILSIGSFCLLTLLAKKLG